MMEFGEALHALLYYKKSVWEILPERHFYTWTEGGCWLLAHALKKWFGNKASLWSLMTPTHDDIEHVVVRVGACYIDGNGAFSKNEFLALWEQEGIKNPYIEPFNPEKEGRLECAWDAIDPLVAELEAEFGPGPEIIKWAKGSARAG